MILIRENGEIEEDRRDLERKYEERLGEEEKFHSFISFYNSQ